MWFGHDGGDAFEFVLGLTDWMLDGLDDKGPDSVTYGAASWVITAHRA